MSLVSTDWLEKNLKKVKLIDCSWHLPNSKRDPYKEYIDGHIPKAIFFDLDKNSDQNTDLPHMLPNKNSWEKILSSMGISNEDNVIIYDNSDLISSCRCWYTFIYFGHNPKLVSILNGGLKKWKLENKLISNNTIKINKSSYVAKENKELVKDKKQRHNIFGLWSTSLESILEEDLNNNFRKVDLWADKIGCNFIEKDIQNENEFLNINTKEDLELAEKIYKKNDFI